jgi:hypothetical protein
MCIEDIRIGRQTYTRNTFITIGAGATNSTAIIADVKRIGLLIATDGTGRINVGIDGIGATNLFDIIVANPSCRFYDITSYGDMVRHNIQLRNPGAAGVDVTILEVLFEYDEGPKHGTSQPPDIRQEQPAYGGELPRTKPRFGPLGQGTLGSPKG